MTDETYPTLDDQVGYMEAFPDSVPATYDQLVQRVKFLHEQAPTNKSADRVLKALFVNQPGLIDSETLLVVPYSELNDKFTVRNLVEASRLLNGLSVPMFVNGMAVDVDQPLGAEFMAKHKIVALGDAERFTEYVETLVSQPTPPGLFDRYKARLPFRPGVIGTRELGPDLDQLIKDNAKRIHDHAETALKDYRKRVEDFDPRKHEAPRHSDRIHFRELTPEFEQRLTDILEQGDSAEAPDLTPTHQQGTREWIASLSAGVFNDAQLSELREFSSIMAGREKDGVVTSPAPTWLYAQETSTQRQLRRLQGPPIKPALDAGLAIDRTRVRDALRQAVRLALSEGKVDPDAFVEHAIYQLFTGDEPDPQYASLFRQPTSAVERNEQLMGRVNSPYGALYKTTPGEPIELGIMSRLNRRLAWMSQQMGMNRTAFGDRKVLAEFVVFAEGAPMRVQTLEESGVSPYRLLRFMEDIHVYLDSLAIPADVTAEPVFHEFDTPSEETVEHGLTMRMNRRFDFLWRIHGLHKIDFAGQASLLKFVTITEGSPMRVKLSPVDHIPSTRMHVLENMHGYLDRLEVPAEHLPVADGLMATKMGEFYRESIDDTKPGNPALSDSNTPPAETD